MPRSFHSCLLTAMNSRLVLQAVIQRDCSISTVFLPPPPPLFFCLFISLLAFILLSLWRWKECVRPFALSFSCFPYKFPGNGCSLREWFCLLVDSLLLRAQNNYSQRRRPLRRSTRASGCSSVSCSMSLHLYCKLRQRRGPVIQFWVLKPAFAAR